MIVFNEVSGENTGTAIDLAIKKAMELDTDIVLATTSGASAFAVAEQGKKLGYGGKIVAITHVYGMKNKGENELPEESRKALEASGAIIVTAGHALSGVERAISGKFGGVYPVEIMAHTLRMLGQGVKVCVEIAAMAMDSGAIKDPRPVVSLGGTGAGLDTACVITPGYSAKIFETRIHEILCKPY